MRMLLLLLVMLLPVSASITIVDSDITENTIWNTDTVRLMTLITIRENATLTIAPGTRVEGNKEFAWVRLHIDGQVVAVGTNDNPIEFDVETNEDMAQNWSGIRFNAFDTTTTPFDTSYFEYCSFSNTRSPSGSGNFQYGGTFYCGPQSKVIIKNSLFTSSEADYGGFIYSDDSSYVEIENCSFTNGIASEYDGGALFSDGADAFVRIVDCEFENNLCDSGSGGAISIRNANAEIIGCTFRNNSSANGGAVSLSKGAGTISRSLFTGNKALSLGGALVIYNGEYRVDNSIFTFNDCSVKGGAVYCGNSSPLFANLDLYGNTALFGGGFYFSSFSGINPLIVNSFLHNGASESGANIRARSVSDLPSITYSNVIGGISTLATDASEGTAPSLYEKNIDEDPRVKGYEQEDFSRYPESKCIDNGTPDTTGLSLSLPDFYGNPRIANGRIDIGAVEYTGTTAIMDIETINSGSKAIALHAGNLLFKNSTPYTLAVYSVNGRLLKEISGSETTVLLNSLELANGIYQMRVVQGAHVFTGQFILK